MSPFFRLLSSLVVLAAVVVPGTLSAQLPIPPEPNEALQRAFPGQEGYSPYAGRNFPTNVYWGDTHLHTGMSMDAGAFGARLLPEDAHRFARGEELVSSTGLSVKLARPLDFLVVADHSDNMGFFPRLVAGEPDVLADPTGRDWYDRIQQGGQTAVGVAVEIIQGLTQGTFPEALASVPGMPAYRDAWQVSIDAAETYNEPGVYTALHGYEWTSTEGGINLHRVVIMRDGADEAEMVLPASTVPPEGSPDPRFLWDWMQEYEDRTGGSILAIAHNGNMSNGAMFSLNDHFSGEDLDREYFEIRARWEPLYEVTQIKGDGEAHPLLSPTDEFADYETWDQGNLDLSEIKTDEMIPFEYAREALKIGLQVEEELGVNPYKFGLVGATDSHTGLSTAEEENFFGKHSGAEPNAERVNHPMAKVGDAEYTGWGMVASGLQGVWARENTREAIFDAMARKETYATTGSRMLVRFFGGWAFTEEDAMRRLPGDVGYLKGVPMGRDMPVRPSGAAAPSFLVAAMKDPLSGNLDRIQIVKGWMENGERMERVYDVVWAGDREPGSDGRLPSVGNTVDVGSATWTNTIGAAELITTWEDPDFDPSQRAFYYARVMEIPTPRWTAYEAARYGITLAPEIPTVHQERAYTSPIWYTPN